MTPPTLKIALGWVLSILFWMIVAAWMKVDHLRMEKKLMMMEHRMEQMCLLREKVRG